MVGLKRKIKASNICSIYMIYTRNIIRGLPVDLDCYFHCARAVRYPAFIWAIQYPSALSVYKLIEKTVGIWFRLCMILNCTHLLL